MKIGFIGMGNMGFAMLKGIMGLFPKNDIIFSEINKNRCEAVCNETEIEYVDSNAECANKSKYIILAVKPQYYDQVLKSIENVVREEHVIISIAPGITIDYLKNKLGADKRIVRAMPNTPALLGAGMTGICYDDKIFNFEEIEIIEKIFSSFGRFRKVEERQMSAVTCVSGSSPAYVYMMIDALADGAVKYGLSRDAAIEMAAQAVMGSAKMVLETKEHPSKLKDNVCSPGGTTIAGVSALEEYGFRNSIIKACDLCYKKSEGID